MTNPFEQKSTDSAPDSVLTATRAPHPIRPKESRENSTLSRCFHIDTSNDRVVNNYESKQSAVVDPQRQPALVPETQSSPLRPHRSFPPTIIGSSVVSVANALLRSTSLSRGSRSASLSRSGSTKTSKPLSPRADRRSPPPPGEGEIYPGTVVRNHDKNITGGSTPGGTTTTNQSAGANSPTPKPQTFARSELPDAETALEQDSAENTAFRYRSRIHIE